MSEHYSQAVYQHKQLNGIAISLPTGKVVCVGRNYQDHIQELGNERPDYPVIFHKPSTSLVNVDTQAIELPKDKGECHNELELAVLIQHPLKNANTTQALDSIWGIGLGLDLTLRTLQSDLKSKGLPWERAKAFDGSCPVTQFVPFTREARESAGEEFLNCRFELAVNGETRQQGDTRHMIWPVLELLQVISREFTLMPGDVVMTGTPKGVGALRCGDKLSMRLDNEFGVSFVQSSEVS